MLHLSSVLVLLACAPSAVESRLLGPIASVPAEDTAPAVVDTGRAEPTTSPSSAATGDSTPLDTASQLEPFDCATVPFEAGPEVLLEAPRGYNDVVFTDDGTMVGSDTEALVRASSATTSELFVPGVGLVYKLDRLEGGDIVMSLGASAGGGVLRVTPSGGSTLLASGLLGHGMAVGPDGSVFLATNYTAGIDAIFQIDPDTGDAEMVIDASIAPPRDIAIHPDGTRLYWGTLDGGDVWAVDLDASGRPVLPAVRVAQVPNGWHDTVEVDACGNLYVGSVFASAIFRVRTTGEVQTLLDWSFDNYGHGLEWGDAQGGWNDRAIYVTHPYIGSRVTEVVVGVPGPDYRGPVLPEGKL